MKKVWKWVIGIVIVLVIVAAVVGGVFLVLHRFGNIQAVTRSFGPGLQQPGPGFVPGPGNAQPGGPQQYRGMRPYGQVGPGMYMRGRGMMGFGGFNILGGIVRGLLTLGLLALTVLGVVWLVTTLRRPMAPVAAAAPIAPPAPMSPSDSTSNVAPVALVATHPCPNCGEPVQEDWKHCPHCGKSL